MLTSSDDTNSSAPAFTGLSLIFMSINGKAPTTIGEVLYSMKIKSSLGNEADDRT